MGMRGNTPSLALRATVVATLFTIVWCWVTIWVIRFDTVFGFRLPSWLWPAGVVLVIVGGLVAAWCVVLFAREGQGTPAPVDPPKVFVATGPYRFVRNPMYVGFIGMLSGLALILRSPSSLSLALLLLAVGHPFVVFYEEPSLRQRFGDSYLRYCRRVPRWLPLKLRR
jgi:protein-S-isoprenylcysteine O-methyltransferase Ste14